MFCIGLPNTYHCQFCSLVWKEKYLVNHITELAEERVLAWIELYQKLRFSLGVANFLVEVAMSHE